MRQYDFLMVLTEKCNLDCPHCYQAKKGRSLTTAQVDRIADNLSANLSRLSLEGGEVYMERDLFYYAVRKFRKVHGPDFFLRVETNGTFFYDDESHILREADFLVSMGVNEIKISMDNFHKLGGADLEKLAAIGNVLGSRNHPMKFKYLSLHEAVAVGNAESLPSAQKQVRRCMNKPDCLDHPYFFSDVMGNIYTCPWRIVPSFGNIITHPLDNLAKGLSDPLQRAILVGDIKSMAALSGKERLYDLISGAGGECMVCKEACKDVS